MISADPRLPRLPADADSWLKAFYERFYRLWRELSEYVISRPFTPRQTYSTSWTATSGTAPAILNGTLSSEYTVRDGFCKVRIKLLGGPLTNWGNGGFWKFTVPYNALVDSTGPVFIEDSGTTYYAGVAILDAGGSTLFIVRDNSGQPVTYNSPMTWATNDRLLIELEYPI